MSRKEFAIDAFEAGEFKNKVPNGILFRKKLKFEILKALVSSLNTDEDEGEDEDDKSIRSSIQKVKEALRKGKAIKESESGYIAEGLYDEIFEDWNLNPAAVFVTKGNEAFHNKKTYSEYVTVIHCVEVINHSSLQLEKLDKYPYWFMSFDASSNYALELVTLMGNGKAFDRPTLLERYVEINLPTANQNQVADAAANLRVMGRIP